MLSGLSQCYRFNPCEFKELSSHVLCALGELLLGVGFPYPELCPYRKVIGNQQSIIER